MLSLWLLAVEGSSTSANLAQLNEMVTLRLLAVEISPSRAIYRNSMLLHNSSSYNHEWWPVLEYLDCTVEGFLIADWAIKRNVLVDSIT